MRWFKHMTDARNDEKISALSDKFGLEGIGFYWTVLEIVAQKMNEKLQTSASFSAKKWGSFAGISAKKFQNLAEFCASLNLFEMKNEGNLISINIPKLLFIKDEHTRKTCKNSGVYPDKVGSLSRLDIDIDIDKEEEFKTPLTPLTENEASCPAPRPPVGVGGERKNTSDDFLDEPEIEFQELRQFYNENARQEGPLAGHAEYKALVYRKLFNFATIMQGILRLKEHDSEWIRGYAPGLAKFLRERGWEKEAVTMKKPSSSRAHIIAAARGEKYAEN